MQHCSILWGHRGALGTLWSGGAESTTLTGVHTSFDIYYQADSNTFHNFLVYIFDELNREKVNLNMNKGNDYVWPDID